MGTPLRAIAAAIALLCVPSLSPLVAETFTRTDGSVIEGQIDHLNEKEVTFKTSDGEFVTALLAALDPASASAVHTWSEANPGLNGVYSVWDVKPSVVRSRTALTPPQLNTPGFKGRVSLQVILDEKGKVSQASVSKSTHGDLEKPAIEAIRKWSFKPAQVAGKTVKARIAISFKFEA